MPQGFAKQVVVAVLAVLAIGCDIAWADRFHDPRDGGQLRMDPRASGALRMDPRESGPLRMDPRDGGLPASVRRIQRETGGQVLRAQPIQRDGREVYRVKVLTPQGRIRVVEEIPPPPRERPLRDEPPPYPPRNHWPE